MAFQARPDWDLLQQYGEDIFPTHLCALLNVDVRKLRHRCSPGTSLPSINGELFALLYKLVCVVESKPVVTRCWTFFPAINALARCKLLGLPDWLFSSGATQPRPENERRLVRFRTLWQEAGTDKHLRSVTLCLRLAKLAVDIASQRPQRSGDDARSFLHCDPNIDAAWPQKSRRNGHNTSWGDCGRML